MSPDLHRRINELFPRDAAAVVARLEAECGSGLPMIAKQGENGIERVRSAVLKLSDGKLEKLDHALHRANRDWRDVLVWSGFGNDAFAHGLGYRRPASRRLRQRADTPDCSRR
ncbi:MAG TPA: hypothetical protein VFE13_14685 [Caulobacteraceae bacterium]|nr:hypothetical protein [Caulobacteraceae bacterium]